MADTRTRGTKAHPENATVEFTDPTDVKPAELPIETPAEKPADTKAETFTWDEVESETYGDPLPADVEVPVGIRNLMVRALDDGPQIVNVSEWSDARVKDFERHVRASKGPLVLTYVRVEKVLRHGKKSLRVTASRKPRAKPGEAATASDVKTDETSSESSD